MAVKFTLKAKPTFKAMVPIPVAGEDAMPLLVEFRHRTKAQLDEFLSSREGKTDCESFMDMACGWELEDAFSVENVEELLQNYAAAALEAYKVYIDQLVKVKAKN